MTVATETMRVEYAGTGSLFAFDFPHPFAENDDLVVILHNDTTGANTAQTLDVDYTLTGAGTPGGGTATFVTAPASGVTVVIYRSPEITQEVDLAVGGGLSPEAVEDGLDKFTFVLQRLHDLVQRSIRLQDGHVGAFSLELPDLLPAGYVLRVNSGGTGIELVQEIDPGAVTITAFAETLLDDANAAAARTTLGVTLPVGKQHAWIPAGAMTPTVSNGCAALAVGETTAGRPDIAYLAFDASSDEHAQFMVRLGNSWNRGTLTFVPVWTHGAGAVTDGVAWGLQAVAMGDGDTFDVAYGTPIVVTDDAQGASEEVNVGAESAALTVGGTPLDGDVVAFRVFRDVSDANDDLASDAWLVGITVFFTTDAVNDA